MLSIRCYRFPGLGKDSRCRPLFGLLGQAKDDGVEYVHAEVGYNYRLTNVQAAMGVAQMELFEDFIRSKRRIAAAYGEALDGVEGLTPMREAEWATSVYWLYTVLVDSSKFGLSSREVMYQLAQLLKSH